MGNPSPIAEALHRQGDRARPSRRLRSGETLFVVGPPQGTQTDLQEPSSVIFIPRCFQLQPIGFGLCPRELHPAVNLTGHHGARLVHNRYRVPSNVVKFAAAAAGDGGIPYEADKSSAATADSECLVYTALLIDRPPQHTATQRGLRSRCGRISSPTRFR